MTDLKTIKTTANTPAVQRKSSEIQQHSTHDKPENIQNASALTPEEKEVKESLGKRAVRGLKNIVTNLVPTAHASVETSHESAQTAVYASKQILGIGANVSEFVEPHIGMLVTAVNFAAQVGIGRSLTSDQQKIVSDNLKKLCDTLQAWDKGINAPTPETVQKTQEALAKVTGVYSITNERGQIVVERDKDQYCDFRNAVKLINELQQQNPEVAESLRKIQIAYAENALNKLKAAAQATN